MKYPSTAEAPPCCSSNRWCKETLEIARRGCVIQNGRIVQSGPARELLDSDDVRKAYLGM
jgi:ABC-type branched-subunit amino acid transport system ATPase component